MRSVRQAVGDSMRADSVDVDVSYDPLTDRLIAIVSALTLASYVLEGPLRYVLFLVSAESLLYVRDLAAVAALGLCVLSWLRGQRAVSPLVGALFVLSAHCAIGLLTLPSAFQALFGLKVFLVFLLGFATAPLVARQPARVTRFAAFAFFATASGVALNTVVEFPWVGLSYETAFGTTVASRQWWTGGSGLLRLPGFARASFTAATIIVVSLVPLLAARGSPWRKLGLLAIASGTIWLTTTKGAFTGMAALLVGSGLTLIFAEAQLASAFVLLLGVCCLALPLVAVQVGTASGNVPYWMSSFMDRVGDMWPRAFALLDHPGQWLWGRGLGGIGAAQEYGESARFNSADNLMIYVLVAFGLCGLVYVGVFLLRLTRFLGARAADDLVGACARGWTLLWLSYGLTGGMIDQPVMNMMAGIVFGLAFGMEHVLQRGQVCERVSGGDPGACAIDCSVSGV